MFQILSKSPMLRFIGEFLILHIFLAIFKTLRFYFALFFSFLMLFSKSFFLSLLGFLIESVFLLYSLTTSLLNRLKQHRELVKQHAKTKQSNKIRESEIVLSLTQNSVCRVEFFWICRIIHTHKGGLLKLSKLEDFKAKYGSEGLQSLILQLKYLSQKGGYLQSKIDVETIDNLVKAIDELMRDWIWKLTMT